MNIAILCHTGHGGSGIMATELAIALCECGFNVHLIGEQRPFRLNHLESQPGGVSPLQYVDLGDAPPVRSFWGQAVGSIQKSLLGRFAKPKTPATRKGSLHFHEIRVYEYPLFGESSLMTLRMANTLVEVIERHGIELVHAHYAIPHATSAILARDSGLPIKVMTTLHGTDVTTVGSDPAFLFSTRHALNLSDGVTAVSQSLINAARTLIGTQREITHIPNWVDANRFKRIADPRARGRYAQPEEAIILHASNFRPVKNSTGVIRIFAQICKSLPARLLLVGDGPDKAACIDLAVDLGVSGRVCSLPPIAEIEGLIGISDLVLLPSLTEAFPLLALEAMACESAVIASNVGGLPEMIEHGSTGFLFPPEDLEAMANTALALLRDVAKLPRLRRSAKETVLERYQPEVIIQRYIAAYEATIGSRAGASAA